MIFNISVFINLNYQGHEQVVAGDGSSIPIQHKGNGILPTPSHTFTLNDFLRVPKISSNLILVYQLVSNNHCTITFDANGFVIQDKTNKFVLYKGSHSHGLYQLPVVLPFFSHHQACVSATNAPADWHSRLCHPSPHKLQMLCNKFHLSTHSNKSTPLCPHCCVAKSRRLPFSLFTSFVNQPLAIIHSDVWGPFTTPNSTFSYKYYALFVDEFSKFTWLFPLHYKSEVFSKFIEFKHFQHFRKY